jgi:hypothetical protein
MTNVEEAKARTSSSAKVGSEKNSESPEDPNDSASTRSSDEKGRFAKFKDHQYARACWNLVTWTPKRCRWDPESPPQFSMGLNLLFGFVSTSCSKYSLILMLLGFHNGYAERQSRASREISL